MNLDLLTHRLSGTGDQAVLTLNGGMMTHAAWQPVVASLEGSYQVLGCDLRGQLQTPGAGHSRLEDHLPDLIALLDSLDLHRVHVLGTSFGGEIGVLLAARHPERVLSLAAVTAVDRTPTPLAENVRDMKVLTRQAADGGDTEAFHDALIRDVYSPTYLAAHAEELRQRRRRPLPRAWFRGLLAILTSVEDFDLRPELGAVRCPTLVVHAARDTVMPLDRVRALADGVAGAELRIHPTSGHALVLEDPEWLARVYGEFLDSRDTGDSP